MSRRVVIAASEGRMRIMGNICMINRVVLIRWVIGIVGMVVIAPGAEATIIMPVAQERYVKADAVAGDPDLQGMEDHASDFASGFGPFDSTVSASVYEGRPWASASQSSMISSANIIANGSAESGGVETWAMGRSVSSFSLTFELGTPQEFSITGSLSASGQSSTAVITFTGPSGTIFDASVSPAFWWDPPVHTDFAISGTLASGRYTLTASSRSDAYIGETPAASFGFLCEIPEPATLVLFGLGMAYLVKRKQRGKI